VLTEQSKRKWIVRTVHKLGWLDQERRPLVRAWIRKQLVGKMGKDYSFDVGSSIPKAYMPPPLTSPLQELPLEYNTWLLFRQAVDIILIKCVPILVIYLSISKTLIPSDFLSFCLFAFACFRVPSGLSMFVHVLR
jgi:phosphatidylethanolamine N-methyltransferase